MISTITLKNLKGVSRTIRLTGRDVIVAPNFTGKTAFIDGLRLACLGYIPTEEKPIKTNQALFELSSGTTMSVSCERTTAEMVEDFGVTLTLKGKTVSLDRVEPEWIDSPLQIMLDPAKYFEASGPAKVTLMCALIGVSDKMRVSDIVKDIGKVKVKDLEDKEVTAAIVEVLKKLKIEANLIPEAIEEMEAFFKAEKSSVDDAMKRMATTASGLSDLSVLRGELEALPSRDSLSQKLFDLTNAIQEVNRQIGAASARAATVANAQRRKTELEAKIQGGPEMKAEIDRLTGLCARMSADSTDLEPQITEALRAENKLKADIEKMTEEAKALHDEGQELADNEEIREIVKATDEPPPAGQHELHVRATISEEGKLSDVSIVSWVRIQKASDAQIQAGEAKMDQASTLFDNIEQAKEEYAAAQQSTQDLRDRLTAIRNDLSVMEGKKRNLESEYNSLQAYTEELAQHEKTLSEETGDQPDHSAILEGHRTEEQSVKDTLAKITELEQDQQRAEEAQAEAKKLKVKSAAIAEAQKIVAAKKVEVVDGSVAEGLKVANRFGEGIFRAPITYRAGQIGMMLDGTFVPYTTFSGAERKLTRLAMGVALAAKSKLKLALVDELSVFDDHNKEKMISNLNTLQKEGVIDQYLLGDCRSVPLGGCNLIEIGV